MKTGFPRRAPAWAMLAAGLVLTGCGTSPPQTFHLLTRYAADVSPPQAGERAYGIAIGSIGLPDAVARPQLVISETGSRLAIREQQRWAEPLAADIGRALAENLAQALPEAYVYSQAASAAATSSIATSRSRGTMRTINSTPLAPLSRASSTWSRWIPASGTSAASRAPSAWPVSAWRLAASPPY